MFTSKLLNLFRHEGHSTWEKATDYSQIIDLPEI